MSTSIRTSTELLLGTVSNGFRSFQEEATRLNARSPLYPDKHLRLRVLATERASPSLSRTKKSSNKDDFHGTLHALKSKNRVPKKWLGQHYMVNNEINEKLVECANIQKGDIVLEIGPGTGSLTNSLVEAGAYVIAVEKDPAMAELIMERFQDSGLVEVVNEDFMKWRIRSSIEYFRNHYSAKGIPFKQIKVVSNLPFNITTPVVKRILPMGDIFSSMVLLLQDEAAYRLIDMSPQASNYRSISLFVQFFSVAQYEMKVSRSNFFPRPNVDGAIISFNIKSALDYPSVSSTKSFFTLVNMAFAEKRKMLRNSLEHKHSPAKIRNALKSVNLDETARPAELTLDQFVALYNALDASKENHSVDCT